MIQLPHKKVCKQHYLGSLGWIFELDRSMSKGISEGPEGALEEVHLSLLLGRFRFSVNQWSAFGIEGGGHKRLAFELLSFLVRRMACELCDNLLNLSKRRESRLLESTDPDEFSQQRI